MMTAVISIFAISKASAQITWGIQPSNCDENDKRSISATVKNNTNEAGEYSIKVYGPYGDLVHGSHKVYINVNETKPIVLKGVPAGYFSVIVFREHDRTTWGSKFYTFNPCPEEDIIIWEDEIICVDNSRRVTARVTNNSTTEAHDYKITTYNANGSRIHPGISKSIGNGVKKSILGFVYKSGYILADLLRDGIVVSTKKYRVRPCVASDNVDWADHSVKNKVHVKLKYLFEKAQNDFDERLINTLNNAICNLAYGIVFRIR